MEAFVKESVVPLVVDQVPPAQLKVTYNGKEVIPGSVWTPTQVEHAPAVSWDVDAGALYTLIMTDPDIPSRDQCTDISFNHWIVVNIPGCDVSKGEHQFEYIGSGPPKGSGLHRYVFLLYKQTERKDFSALPHCDGKTASGRTGNDMARHLAKTYELGQPIAGNIYLAEYDDSVPALHARIGFKPE